MNQFVSDILTATVTGVVSFLIVFLILTLPLVFLHPTAWQPHDVALLVGLAAFTRRLVG